jgi:hypothetical protein
LHSGQVGFQIEKLLLLIGSIAYDIHDNLFLRFVGREKLLDRPDVT